MNDSSVLPETGRLRIGKRDAHNVVTIDVLIGGPFVPLSRLDPAEHNRILAHRFGMYHLQYRHDSAFFLIISHHAHEHVKLLTSGTTPTPSPMNMGATVIIMLSTTGDPSDRGSECRNAERMRDPPSIMTERRASFERISGRSRGGIRPVVSGALGDLGILLSHTRQSGTPPVERAYCCRRCQSESASSQQLTVRI